jgi:hypothetical protein
VSRCKKTEYCVSPDECALAGDCMRDVPMSQRVGPGLASRVALEQRRKADRPWISAREAWFIVALVLLGLAGVITTIAVLAR